MRETKLHLAIDVRAPIDFVFERISDHEAMSDWPGIGKCKLVREGTPRNGLGAVRKVTARGLTLLEEIVRFEAPLGYDYKITKGLPVDHLGQVQLTEVDGGVHVTWDIRMSSRVPLLAAIVGHLLRDGLPKALEYFKVETEKAAENAR